MRNTTNKIQPGNLYEYGVFTDNMEKTGDLQNPAYRKGSKVVRQGKYFLDKGINNFQDYLDNNPDGLSHKNIYHFYDVTNAENRTHAYQGTPMQNTAAPAHTLADGEEYERSSSYRVRELLDDIKMLRERITALETQAIEKDNKIAELMNRVIEAAEIKASANAQLDALRRVHDVEKQALSDQFSHERESLSKLHETELDAKIRAAKDTLEDSLADGNDSNLAETIAGIMQVAQPLIGLGTQWLQAKLQMNLHKQQVKEGLAPAVAPPPQAQTPAPPPEQNVNDDIYTDAEVME